jgi:hypothetical protein
VDPSTGKKPSGAGSAGVARDPNSPVVSADAPTPGGDTTDVSNAGEAIEAAKEAGAVKEPEADAKPKAKAEAKETADKAASKNGEGA